MSRMLPNGIGETAGDTLVTNTGPLYLTSDRTVWYVSSVLGTDAAGPRGREKRAPLATLSQALTNAAAGDIIVLASDHTETRTSALTVSLASLTIVGAGSSSGNPTATLTNNSAAGSLISVTAANVQIRNIKFPQQTQACSATKISCAAASFRLIGCYLEGGQYDDGAQLTVGSAGHNLIVKNSTFISVATSGVDASRPDCAIRITGGAITYPLFDGLVLSNGTYGWYNTDGQNAAFVDVSGMTGARFENISQLLGADIYLDSGTSVSYLSIGTKTGDASIRLSN